MENTVTISLEKYEKFKHQQVEINELQKLLEEKKMKLSLCIPNLFLMAFDLKNISLQEINEY